MTKSWKDTSSMTHHILEKIPLFSDLNSNEISEVQQLITFHEINKGAIVLQEGDYGNTLFIIISGSVKVSKYASDGREVILSLLNEGCTFGEMSLLNKQPRSASITTLTHTKVAQITSDNFRLLLIQQPKVTFKLLAETTARLRQTSKVLERISTLDVPHRLYYYLRDFIANHLGQSAEGHTVAIKLPTHQMIADQLFTSRETISRAMSTLKKESIICKADKPGETKIDMASLETLLRALS